MDEPDLAAIRRCLLSIQALLLAFFVVAVWAMIDAPALVKLIGVVLFVGLAELIVRVLRRR